MSAADATAVDDAAPPADGSERQAGATTRPLSGEKAQRIIDAMRHSVAERGTTGSTFDHVSREAGVSRGLLHYYFGTKEQLLVEAVRRDGELRIERLRSSSATAKTADDFIDLMAQNLQETVREDPDFLTLVFELFTLSRRNEDIAAEYAGADAAHPRAGRRACSPRPSARASCDLHAEPEAVAEILFSLGDGFALRMLTEPDRDFTATIEPASPPCARC